MELSKIEFLVEKYLEAETSIAEEKELQLYFSAPNVAQHLEQYRIVFEFFKQSKKEQYIIKPLLKTKKRTPKWLNIAATILVLFAVGTFMILNKSQKSAATDLGTFNDPEIALKETQKVLAILSDQVNTGITSINYITEYQQSKERIFN